MLVLSLSYDTSILTLESVSNGGMFSGFTKGRNYVFDSSDNVTDDGVLMTLTFTVADDAPSGSYPVGIIVREATDEDYEDVEFAAVAGTLTVFDYIYGDVNGDGELNSKDVTAIRRYLANFDYDTGVSSVEIFPGADANGDGEVNSKDVTILRRYFANFDYDTGVSTVVLGPAN